MNVTQCHSADSRIPFSCIIRNALQWVQSPLARRGDFSLVAYVVRTLFPIGCRLSHSRRNCNVSSHGHLICCIRTQTHHLASSLMWITYSSLRLLSARSRRGTHRLPTCRVKRPVIGSPNTMALWRNFLQTMLCSSSTPLAFKMQWNGPLLTFPISLLAFTPLLRHVRFLPRRSLVRSIF